VAKHLCWKRVEEVHVVMGNRLAFLASGEDLAPELPNREGANKSDGSWSTSETVGGERACKWCGRFSSRVKDTVESPLCGICQLRLSQHPSLQNSPEQAFMLPAGGGSPAGGPQSESR
jgi:hypothetical protein